MHSVCVSSERNIDSFIDKKWSTIARAYWAQGNRKFVHWPRIKILLAKLNRNCTARRDFRGRVQYSFARADQIAIANQLAIGDDVESKRCAHKSLE